MHPWRSMAKNSPEGRLIEASQLAGMQGRALAPQDVERGQANLKVLANSPLVKGIRRTRQLDLSMQRLVGNTEQRPIRHPQPVALRRNRAALHVHSDGPGQIDPPSLLRPAQLPVAIVVGDDRSGSQPPLQPVSMLAGDARCRLLQRDLNFSEGRDRDFWRDERIEDAVPPQIAMSQHVVADRL